MMAPPSALPEWTLVDFIHRGSWWTNRGKLHHGRICHSLIEVARNISIEPLPVHSSHDVFDQWLRLIFGQRYVRNPARVNGRLTITL